MEGVEPHMSQGVADGVEIKWKSHEEIASLFAEEMGYDEEDEG